jgi:hypothetical protein
MFVMFVHTGEKPVHRLLAKMSTSTINLRSPTFLAKILELVSTNSLHTIILSWSYKVPLLYLLCIIIKKGARGGAGG